MSKQTGIQKCSNSISTLTKFIINMTIHVFIAFIFLTIMFYLLIGPTEEETLQSEIDHLIVSIVEESEILPENNQKNTNFASILNSIIGDQQNDLIDTIKLNYKGENKIKKLNNNWLKVVNIIVAVTLFIIPFIILLTIKFLCKVNNIKVVRTILGYNCMIIVFVISFEIYFVLNIGINYIPVNPEIFVKDVVYNSNKKLLSVLKNN